MSNNVLLAVGSVLRGDDAAGPLLAKMMTDSPVEGCAPKTSWASSDGRSPMPFSCSTLLIWAFRRAPFATSVQAMWQLTV